MGLNMATLISSALRLSLSLRVFVVSKSQCQLHEHKFESTMVSLIFITGVFS